MIPRIKSKTSDERFKLQLALSRLRDVSVLVLEGSEPMLSIRLDALVGEVTQAYNNSKEVK